MPTIQDQLDFEEKMMSWGRARYMDQHDGAIRAGRGGDTQAGKALLKHFLPDMVEYLKKAQPSFPTSGAKFWSLITRLDLRVVAFIALRTALDRIMHPDPEKRRIQVVGMFIGERIEDEQVSRLFDKEHKAYFKKLLRGFKENNTSSQRHKHRVIINRAKVKALRWQPWTKEEQVRVGVLMLDAIHATTGLIERKLEYRTGNKYGTIATVDFTPEAQEWIKKWIENAADLYPMFMPTIIPPAPWVSMTNGGYYSPAARRQVRFVKTHGRAHWNAIKGHDYSKSMSAINLIQQTPWRVNTDIWNIATELWNSEKAEQAKLPRKTPIVMLEFPDDISPDRSTWSDETKARVLVWKNQQRDLYAKEKKRVGFASLVASILRTSGEMSDYERFWFVHQCDFRGREYPTCNWSPQSPDLGRALLDFADGHRITARGIRWVRIACAKLYGEKGTYERLHSWTNERLDTIKRYVADPIGTVGEWGKADKPFLFLRACMEVVHAGSNPDYISHFRVGLDGKCNGLQHYSALLRDNVGGDAVNITPNDEPRDIYQVVADRVNDKISTINAARKAGLSKLVVALKDAGANRSYYDKALCPEYSVLTREALDTLQNVPITRDITKVPVMTRPYGSTLSNCLDIMYQKVAAALPDRKKYPDRVIRNASKFLSFIVWAAINETVISSQVGMQWLQKSAMAIGKAGLPFVYETPLEFKVYHAPFRTKGRPINTFMAGKTTLRIPGQEETIAPRLLKQGVPPNFIHSLDATHLMKTVIRCNEEWGITSFGMVHDDYGVHAAYVDHMHKAIREEFVSLYTDFDIMEDLKVQLESHLGEDLPALPPMGTLDIKRVVRSPYFFG